MYMCGCMCVCVCGATDNEWQNGIQMWVNKCNDTERRLIEIENMSMVEQTSCAHSALGQHIKYNGVYALCTHVVSLMGLFGILLAGCLSGGGCAQQRPVVG